MRQFGRAHRKGREEREAQQHERGAVNYRRHAGTNSYRLALAKFIERVWYEGCRGDENIPYNIDVCSNSY